METVLQKVISESGLMSRRQAEAAIRAGRVKVDGKKAELGQKADPIKQTVTISGKTLPKRDSKIYLKFNKPAGYTCTNREFAGEKNIFSLLPHKERLFSVGRLDKDSRGLIILTNDGDLALKLEHPRYGHEKVYEVTLREKPKDGEALALRLKQGMDIGQGDGKVRAVQAQYLQNGRIIITLNEGKKRQIRRMFQALDTEVADLKRTEFANLKLGYLTEGKWETLTEGELKKLKGKN